MNDEHFLQVGVARTEITAYERRMGMMGWGMLHNFVESVATPLHARAFYVEASGRPVVMVVAELAFISLALREEVCRRLREEHPELGLDLPNVMLMATHTHSGPGGFTHYPFYNVTIPGFSVTVLEQLAAGIVAAVVQAHAARCEGRVRFAQGEFDPQLEVAFNRSTTAYNLNPDVEPVRPEQWNIALDRTMRLLRFETADGKALGAINWFAVHCTSVHSDNTALHFDNKGYAARFVEERWAEEGHPEFVAAFAQGATGDVTPNFKDYEAKPWRRGKFLDDDASARFNGRIQADKALELIDAAQSARAVDPELRFAHRFVDFSDVEVDANYSGRPNRRTGPAEIGMAMFFGTEEGPGLPRSLLFLQRWISAVRPLVRVIRSRNPAVAEKLQQHQQTQAEKIPWVESGRRRLLGIRRIRKLPLPWPLHPSLKLVRELDRNDDVAAKPWTPSVLPVQLFTLGGIAIAAVPHEFTTVSGRRLRATVAEAIGDRVEHSILAGYANAYAGYVTTAEEYALQDYEGASTHFGKWTLAAWQTEFARLAAHLDASEAVTSIQKVAPPKFDPGELEVRAFGRV